MQRCKPGDIVCGTERSCIQIVNTGVADALSQCEAKNRFKVHDLWKILRLKIYPVMDSLQWTARNYLPRL